MIRAYIMRHGSTSVPSAQEGWKPVGLNREGWGQAKAGADFLSQFIRNGNPRPDWGVSSDLERAEETLSIVADFLHLPKLKPQFDLRALNEKVETEARFEQRTHAGFSAVLEAAQRSNTVPLIVCHRSSNVALGKFYGLWEKEPDYETAALLLNGGVMAMTENHLEPLFRVMEKNWPKQVEWRS